MQVTNNTRHTLILYIGTKLYTASRGEKKRMPWKNIVKRGQFIHELEPESEIRLLLPSLLLVAIN